MQTDARGLRFDRICKSFPGVRALDDVSFDVRPGSVHALLGENGAGKSTLLKILAGVYRPDNGAVFLDGSACVFTSPREAIGGGIAVIHQELHLVPEMSVAENLFLGHLPASGGWLRRSRLYEQAAKLLSSLGEEIDPRQRVGRLSIGQRQMLEIAKALSREARVIAFDEPTSSLSVREVERLFAVICSLRQAGKIVLYVSHRLDEIDAVCDAGSVLRDGRHVETFAELRGVGRQTLVERMVGRTIRDIFNYTPRTKGEPVLRVRELSGPGLGAPATLEIHRGEIVGIFGLVGAGRTELLKLIAGVSRASAGSIEVEGEITSIASPADAIRRGIALAPEDRKKEGIIPAASVMENINISSRRRFSPLGCVIHPARERANARKQVDALAVRTPSLRQTMSFLSGGNQQKVILGRWLANDPKVLLLDEPTRGIDVGAKSEIYSIIYRLAESGVGVLVVSSELPEVLGISDRVLVMRQGRIVGLLQRSEATQQRVLELALPVSTEAA